MLNSIARRENEYHFKPVRFVRTAGVGIYIKVKEGVFLLIKITGWWCEICEARVEDMVYIDIKSLREISFQDHQKLLEVHS